MTDYSQYLFESETKTPELPVLKFKYQYKYPFLTIAQAFLHKYTYEPRTQLTTFAGVEQVDEDRFVVFRRVETVFSPNISYERVVYDRRNGGQITSELMLPVGVGAEKVFERGTLKAEGEDAVSHTHDLLDHQGVKTLKIDHFKTNVEKILKAVKFAQFEQQQ